MNLNKFDLLNIPEIETKYNITLSKDLFKCEDDQINVAENIEGEIYLYRSNDDVFLKGSLDFPLEINCSNCLEKFIYNLRIDLNIIYLRLNDNEDPSTLEDMSDDIITSYYIGQEVIIDYPIRDQILLSIPFSAKCNEDCKGLCGNCGKNLNFENCNCSEIETNFKVNIIR